MRTLGIATAALAVGVALGLAHVACVIGLHVPFDPNEGWNAYFAQAAMATGSPYPPAQGFLVNNYPPLSFYLVGAVGRIFGDAIVAGRVVSLAAFVAVALGIERAARQLGCNRLETLFGTLLFAAWLMLTTDYVGMDDPQMLGHAVAMGGLLLALREPATPRAMVGAAALCVLAFFIKHNLVVLPAALGLWLLLAERRLAITFIASGIIFLLIGLGVFKQAFGISMLAQIDSARSFALSNVWTGLSPWLRWGAIPVGGALVLLFMARRDRSAMFCVIYAAAAVVAGAFFLGGAGVDANAMFDADIALSLALAVLINRLGAGVLSGVAALLALVPAAVALSSLDEDWRDTAYWFHPMAEDRVTTAAEIALIRAAQGPVLCDMLSLCYWAGKPAEVDVFNMQQAFLTGRRSDGPLVELVDRRRFRLIVLETLRPFPLTARIRNAIEQHYTVVRTDDERTFFAPR